MTARSMPSRVHSCAFRMSPRCLLVSLRKDALEPRDAADTVSAPANARRMPWLLLAALLLAAGLAALLLFGAA